MLDELRVHLGECGFASKEIDVYLTMLQLGSASVQEIAQRAGINRSTAYMVIEKLQLQGLVATFSEGKKILFSAEDPQRLLSLVTEESSRVAAKKERLEQSLPKLLALFNARSDKPGIRFFEGEEALSVIREEIGQSRESIWEVYAVDEELIRLANTRGRERVTINRRATSGRRALMAIKPGCVPPFFDLSRSEARMMDYHRYPFSGDIVLTGDRLYILAMKRKPLGIIIESKQLTIMFRALFENAWSCAAAWSPPPGWGAEWKKKAP
ncbi:hypothetical protein EXS71_01870 [Candidatus Uhrbacteria bacterium]|nr:hypothetical protein [Candidatus Uhrbacteria bacterium]